MTQPDQSVAVRPITMQDVRLAAGEGPLSAADVLAGCNAVIAMRAANGGRTARREVGSLDGLAMTEAMGLLRGEPVGAGDGDTFIPRTLSPAALADALAGFARAAIRRLSVAGEGE